MGSHVKLKYQPFWDSLNLDEDTIEVQYLLMSRVIMFQLVVVSLLIFFALLDGLWLSLDYKSLQTLIQEKL